MGLLDRLMGKPKPTEPDLEKVALADGLDKAEVRLDRAIRDYRSADIARARTAKASRAAGERLIDEVTRDS